jgi:Fic family protein
MEKKQRVGHYRTSQSVGGESFGAYVPKPLPPVPPLDLSDFQTLLEQANVAVGRLDGLSSMLPDTHLFLYYYVRKEAVVSSQIEGTQSSLSDLLLYESEEEPGVPFDDVQEVSCYVKALSYGLRRMKELPLSLRLIREIHAELMASGRGSHQSPGEFRRTQNWIGGSRPGNAAFVPPPVEELMTCLDSFEKFLHQDDLQLPVLIKAALVHVQFETIHPFLDGNGRLGRLLITLMLCSEGLLQEPLLYLSLYLKNNRDRYYSLLQAVRTEGDWEAWIRFFLQGVAETAQGANETARNILTLFATDLKKISDARCSLGVEKIYTCLKQSPIVTSAKIIESTRLTRPTVLRNLAVLEDLGLVREITGKDRHKLFVYTEYLSLLSAGTEPLGRVY